MPTYSVIIAAYKAEATVARAIDSALAQTLPAAEVIVVDDASPDGQHDVIAGYGDQLTYVRRRVNGGEAAAKNTGAHAASGDYVVTLDADDEWLPTRLAAIDAHIASHPDVSIVTTNAAVIRPDGERFTYYDDWSRWPDGDQRRAILERNFLFSHAALPRDLWLAFDMDETDRRPCADWPFWTRLILSGHRAGLVRSIEANYYDRPGSLSSSPVTDARTRLAALTAALKFDLSEDERGFARMARGHARKQLIKARLRR